jgi:hypothetical protein
VSAVADFSDAKQLAMHSTVTFWCAVDDEPRKIRARIVSMRIKDGEPVYTLDTDKGWLTARIDRSAGRITVEPGGFVQGTYNCTIARPTS